jgi:hypothetical protein
MIALEHRQADRLISVWLRADADADVSGAGGAVRRGGGGAAASETSDLWPTATAQTIKTWDTSSLSAAAALYPVRNWPYFNLTTNTS